jgi:hypothetical protein
MYCRVIVRLQALLMQILLRVSHSWTYPAVQACNGFGSSLDFTSMPDVTWGPLRPVVSRRCPVRMVVGTDAGDW